MKINLGCGKNVLADHVNVDSVALPGVDVVADLDRCAEIPLPFSDNSADVLLLQHVLEHIHRPLPLMQELHRVAKQGARLVVRIPYGSSDDAWEDPTHVRPYFIGSFAFFGQPMYWRADYGYRGDWQVERITLLIPRVRVVGMTAEQVLAMVHRDRNVVVEMVAEMKAIKPVRPPEQALQTQPHVHIELIEF